MITVKQKQALYKAVRQQHEAHLAHKDAVFYLKGGISVHCEMTADEIAGLAETENTQPASWNDDGSVATYDVFYWYAYPPV